MSSISTDKVRRLAELVRIALTEDEIDHISQDLGSIADYVAQISEIVTPDTPVTTHPMPLKNVMRPDEVVPTLDREEVLASAPAAESGMFEVPAILGEE
ncbi:MAG: Asp-tRNA(Asn)/Glu-tRNA(Gln) amidotransferase subunit GatC [Actinomycetaceae bacterium]|nr:Asp-tRNA(Asn)/Glu-tRNA(Gln) amidotransferase subunit GatC [Actinomycetaceae bacterium]MDY6083634.1 Asp-tRNA(Asn)/Glu-tRNA(Gln) amidotransferase subunit GatC [Actinomycetaceae bacterium]